MSDSNDGLYMYKKRTCSIRKVEVIRQDHIQLFYQLSRVAVLVYEKKKGVNNITFGITSGIVNVLIYSEKYNIIYANRAKTNTSQSKNFYRSHV